MLDINTFRAVVKNTPLVSIDLCLVHDNKILLGKRNNEPLRRQWFTPGGRILKNESWQDCLKRVTKSELGLNFNDVSEFTLMGIWDHFYPNSAVEDAISTHYVNLPHYYFLKEKPNLLADEQHDNLLWFDLEEIKDNENFHKYMQTYASWLMSKVIKK
jgi:colanic acid biosynthesis protein WcaH